MLLAQVLVIERLDIDNEYVGKPVINVAVLADVPWGRVGQERTLCGVSCGCARWAEFLNKYRYYIFCPLCFVSY